MEIYDEDMQPIERPDLSKGWLEAKKRTVEHEVIIGVKEVGHHEVIAEYANGGKDVAWVVDVPGVEAKDAWTEEVEYLIYHPYTPEELDKKAEEKAKPTIAQRVDALESANDDLILMMADLIGG